LGVDEDGIRQNADYKRLTKSPVLWFTLFYRCRLWCHAFDKCSENCI